MSEMKNRTPSLPKAGDAVDAGMIRRPIRTMSQEIIDMITMRDIVMSALILSLIVVVLLPSTWLVIFPAILTYYMIVASRKYRLPFKVSQAWGGTDYGAPHPGNSGYGKAAGILHVGRDIMSGEELWIENGDARQHGFFLGTTGSGKALPLDALVLTPDGWVYNRDLRPGDPLTHPDGSVMHVHSIHPQGKIPAVRLWFADGRFADCSMDHLWQIRTEPRDGMMPKGLEDKPEIRTAGDLGILIGLRGDELRIAVPLAQPFCGPEIAPNDGLDDDLADGAARKGLRSLNYMPSLRGTPERRRAFLARWIRSSCIQVTAETHGLRLNGIDPQDARILKQIAWSLGGTATDWIPSKPSPSAKVSVTLMFEGIEDVHPSGADCRFPGRRPDLEVVRIDKLDDDIDMSCIKTTRDDGLFVMERHIVTHNTELLLGIVSQTMMWSSGFLFIDGKGTREFYARAWALCKRFGREDDIRVLNFTDAGGDPDAPAGGPDTQSNTVNPFAKGGADELMNIVVSLMGDSSGNDMWKNRAMSLVTAEMKALCELRDAGEILLNVQTVRDFLFIGKGFDKELMKKHGVTKVTSIEQVPEAAWDELRGRAGLIELYLRAIKKDFSQATYLAMKGFFDTLPGFSIDKAINGDLQDPKCLEQYGFLSMQLTKPLGSLADDYGHIFRTPLGEVDIDDVVLNRRILVVLLPALRKASEEMRNCGKIVVTMCKIMMGNAAGHMLQGSRQEIVESNQTRAPSPFIVVLDEAGYYLVDGVDVMMAQARSLGFMIIVAGQDMAAMQKTSPQIAETAAANASIFAAGKTVDGDKTLRFIQAVFGRTQVAVTSGYTQRTGLLTNSWADRMDASVQEVEKVRIDELQNMQAGEFYFLFSGTLVKAATFYIGNKFADSSSVNRFLKVRGPVDQVPGLDQSREIAFLEDLKGASDALARLAMTESFTPDEVAEDTLSRAISVADAHVWAEAQAGKSGAPVLHDAFLRGIHASFAPTVEPVEEEGGDWSASSVDELMADNFDDPENEMDDILAEHGVRLAQMQPEARRPSASETRSSPSVMAEGLARVGMGRTTAERHGGMVDILVAQEAARSEIRKIPAVDRYFEDTKERLVIEGNQQAITLQDYFALVAENSTRLAKVFAEEDVDGRFGLDILRRAGAVTPLPLHAVPDERFMDNTVGELEKMLAKDDQ